MARIAVSEIMRIDQPAEPLIAGNRDFCRFLSYRTRSAIETRHNIKNPRETDKNNVSRFRIVLEPSKPLNPIQ